MRIFAKILGKSHDVQNMKFGFFPPACSSAVLFGHFLNDVILKAFVFRYLPLHHFRVKSEALYLDNLFCRVFPCVNSFVAMFSMSGLMKVDLPKE